MTADKTADMIATEKAEEWCKKQEDSWTYTGNWKQEKQGDKEYSSFQVQRAEKAQETAAGKGGDLPMSMPQSVPKDGEEGKDGAGLEHA